MMPASSPCAPAAGWSVTRSMPLSSASCLLELASTARARPARASAGWSGCAAREAGQARRPLVDLRVVLHRAGAERVEAEVDRDVPGREPREVAHHLDLGDLRQPGQVVAQRARLEAPTRARRRARRRRAASSRRVPGGCARRAAAPRTTRPCVAWPSARGRRRDRVRCSRRPPCQRARRAGRSRRACRARSRRRAARGRAPARRARGRGRRRCPRSSARASARRRVRHVDDELVEGRRREAAAPRPGVARTRCLHVLGLREVAARASSRSPSRPSSDR